MAIIAPDVTPQPIPGIREQSSANETTFGGGPGLEGENQQIQKISQDVGNIAAFERIRANQMAVEDAQAKGSQLTTDVLYNQETGVLGSRGKNSLQAQKDGMERLQKGMNDIATTLTPEQQGAFNKYALSQVSVANQHMMSHVDEQLKIQDADSHKNLIDSLAAQIALGHGNPDTLKLAFGSAKDNTVAYAQRNRLDSDQAKQLLQDTNDKLHMAAIDGMQKFQPTSDIAQKYFDAHRDEISPVAQEKITEALTEGNTRRFAASAAQAAINNNPDSEQEALKALDKVKDPEAQDAARKLVSARFSEDRQAKKNDQDDTFMRMQQMVNQKGFTDPIDRRNAVPPMAWNKMSSEQQRAIEKGGTPDETSIIKWEQFTQAMKDGSLAKMSQADLNSKFIPYFNAADQKTAVDYWSGVKKPGGAGPKEKMYESLSAQVNQTLTGVGLVNAKNPTTSQLALQKQTLDAANRDINAIQASGKTLQPEDITKIIDKHTMPLVAKESGKFFPEVPYEKIPDDAKEDIIDAARKLGVVANKAKIEDAYKFYKNGDFANAKKALQ